MKKVYFAASIRGGRENLLAGKEIVRLLQDEFGFSVLTTHVVRDDVFESESSSPRYVFRRDMAWLKEAGFLVAEVSNPSLGVGYEIAEMLNLKRPVLCLCGKKIIDEDKLSFLIRGNDSPLIRVVTYKKLSELKDRIECFLKGFKLSAVKS